MLMIMTVVTNISLGRARYSLVFLCPAILFAWLYWFRDGLCIYLMLARSLALNMTMSIA